MAIMNVLAQRGIKPTLDMYRMKASEFVELANDVLQKEFGDYEFNISVERSDDDDQGINIWILDEDKIPEDLFEKMNDVGCNPEESYHAQAFILHKIGGGQDMWAEYGGFDSHTREINVDLYINARQDIEIKLTEALEVVMNGSREDAIIELNKLLKEVK